MTRNWREEAQVKFVGMISQAHVASSGWSHR
jgi:hypothetical protein